MSTTAPHPLANDPLAFLTLEKIRRVGADRADGQTITHEGTEYGVTAHTISTITTVHVVLERLNGPGAGHQRAIAIVEVRDSGYQGGPGGLDYVLQGLVNGVHVPGHPVAQWCYHVLPWVTVPPAIATSDDAPDDADDTEQAPG